MSAVDIHLSFDEAPSAEEVITLRTSEGEPQQNAAIWQESIDQALAVATARAVETGELVGVCFLVGNMRHAQIVDLYVQPAYRKDGLGGNLLDMCREHALDKGILYLGLTYNPRITWLKDFYERHFFESIDFAMWHKSSLEYLQNNKLD